MRSRLAVAVGRLTRFVGREHERALLVDRWERAKEGEGQVVLVRGEAGIGKSRLVQTLREHLAGTPHTWLECAASPFFSNTPFFAVAELLRQGFAWRGDEPSEAQVAALERALEAVGLRSEDAVPLVAPLLDLPVSDRFSPPLMSAEQQRRKLLATLVVWVTALARAQPTVLVLEDLHWADPSTLELQELLVAQGAMEPLLLVYTTRPVFTPHWPTRSHHTVLALGRLSRTQTREMIRRMTPSGAIDDEVADLVVGRTDGVPLFVEELTRLVLERSGEAVRTIPETLQDSLMARLDRLGPAKEIAQVGAAIGREFSYALLEATSPAPAAELERALRTLVNSELVHGRGVPPEATYVFRHALVQEAAYAALLKSRRRDLHRAIATALGLRFAAIVADRPELLAHHLTEAGHDERAVPYWFQAGQRSTERSAHVEAIRSLTRGLECVGRLPDGEGRRVLELGLRTLLGANLLAVRGYTAPEVSANCARSLALLAGVDDSSQVRPVVWALWLHHLVLADRDTTRELAVQFHGAAVRGDDDDEALCRAHITNAITAYWQGEFERTRQHAAEARTLYRPEMRLKLPQYGDDSGPYGYIYEAMSLWFQGRPDQARVWIQKGIGVARETHYAFTFAAALSFATQLEQLCRDAAATEALAERTIAYCQEQGFPLYLGAALAHRGWARATQGSVAQGLEDLVAGITLYRATGAVLNVNYLLALIAEAYLLAGDRARGLAAADEGLALAAQHLDTYFVAELHRIRGALLLLAPADPDGAEAALRQALAVAHTQGAAELALRAAIGLGRLLGARGHAADARSLLAEHVARGREAGDRPDLLDAQALLTALA